LVPYLSNHHPRRKRGVRKRDERGDPIDHVLVGGGHQSVDAILGDYLKTKILTNIFCTRLQKKLLRKKKKITRKTSLKGRRTRTTLCSRRICPKAFAPPIIFSSLRKYDTYKS